MKTAHVMIGLSLLTLVHTTSHAASLDVPDDYKAHANQVEFLANVAQRCDLRLSIYGKDGIKDPICLDFLAKVPVALKVNKAREQQWINLGHQVDRSSNRAIQVQWSTFHSQLGRDLDTINKTLDHMKFFQ